MKTPIGTEVRKTNAGEATDKVVRNRSVSSETFIESHRAADFLFRRMTLGNAAKEPERSEGIKTLAVVKADFPALLLRCDPADRDQKIAFRCAMGEDVEHILSFRQVVLRISQELLCKTVVIDPAKRAIFIRPHLV